MVRNFEKITIHNVLRQKGLPRDNDIIPWHHKYTQLAGAMGVAFGSPLCLC